MRVTGSLMRKILATMVLLMLAVVSFGQSYKFVNTETLNIRKSHSVGADVIGQLSQGDEVSVLANDKNWTQIQTMDGTEGYVATKYLSTNQPHSIKDKSKTTSWVPVFMLLGFVGYLVYKVMSFFSGLFGSNASSNSTKRSTPKNETSAQSKPALSIADVRVKTNNYLETFDANSKRIDGMFLPPNEHLVGYSSLFFATFNKNRYFTLYDAKCKRIIGKFLAPNEFFHGCAGSNVTIKNENTNYLTTYDMKLNRVSGRFVQ